MKSTSRLSARLGLAALLALHGFALSGCSAPPRNKADHLFDLGSLPAAAAAPSPLAVSVAEIQTPAWLDSNAMYYRLSYANDQQPRAYASSRWIMPPAQLFVQRLKARLAQSGGVVLVAADGAVNVPVLRIEADDFTQVFGAPGQSMARIGLRASVFNGRRLVSQKSFSRQAAAPTADAAGGAQAMAAAADAAISDMIAWLAALPAAAPASR